MTLLNLDRYGRVHIPVSGAQTRRVSPQKRVFTGSSHLHRRDNLVIAERPRQNVDFTPRFAHDVGLRERRALREYEPYVASPYHCTLYIHSLACAHAGVDTPFRHCRVKARAMKRLALWKRITLQRRAEPDEFYLQFFLFFSVHTYIKNSRNPRRIQPRREKGYLRSLYFDV